mgnify:CR=1 FL=1
MLNRFTFCVSWADDWASFALRKLRYRGAIDGLSWCDSLGIEVRKVVFPGVGGGVWSDKWGALIING